MLSFKEYNIADWFSAYRIIAAPVLLVLLFLGWREWFAIMLLVSYATDAIDGFLARRLNLSSARGAQLDSIGDQITLVIGLLGIAVFETAFVVEYVGWIFLAFVPYLIQMVLAFVKYGRATAFHTYLAKLSAILQAVFILTALFWHPIIPLFFAVLVIGILETLEEITLIFMYDVWVEDVKGYYWALKDERRRKNPTKNKD